MCRQSLRKFLAISVIGFLLTSAPLHAEWSFGLSFDLFSLGPLSISLDVPILGFIAAAFFGSFSSGGGSGGTLVSTGYLAPSDPIPREVLKIRFWDLFDGNAIRLSNGAYLEVEEDGRMRFANSSFQGSATLQYDLSLVIWDLSNDPVLVIMGSGNAKSTLSPAIVCKKTVECKDLAMQLFGGGRNEN